jgi:hypothetical protein
MKNHNRLFAAIVACTLAFVSQPAFAQKNSAAAHYSGDFDSSSISVVATATLDKGKAKRLLLVNATVATPDDEPGVDILASITANGVLLNKGTGAGTTHIHTSCSGDGTIDAAGCTVSATAYLDLDAAEEANPGVFKKQPIVVNLAVFGNTSWFSGSNPVSGVATLVVQMIKK